MARKINAASADSSNESDSIRLATVSIDPAHTGREPTEAEQIETSADDIDTVSINTLEDKATDDAVEAFILRGEYTTNAIVYATAAIIGDDYRSALKGVINEARDKTAFDKVIVKAQVSRGVTAKRHSANSLKQLAKAEAEHARKTEFFATMANPTDTQKQLIVQSEEDLTKFDPNYYPGQIRAINDRLGKVSYGSADYYDLVQERTKLVEAEMARTGYADRREIADLRKACYRLAEWLRTERLAVIANMANVAREKFGAQSALSLLRQTVVLHYGDSLQTDLMGVLNERKKTVATDSAKADEITTAMAEKAKADKVKAAELQKKRDELLSNSDVPAFIMTYVTECNAEQFETLFHMIQEEAKTRAKIVAVPQPNGDETANGANEDGAPLAKAG